MNAEKQLSAFDSAKAEEFANKLLSILNHGALSLMVSIGHRPSLRQWHDRQVELRRAQGEVGQLVEA